MAALTPDDFPQFFRALWGYDPFPWQHALLRRLAAGEDGDALWPDVLDLPTGSGKTAAIDIAVFHLALEAARGEARRAPLRIAFVVDRRIIVDDAFGRAQGIAGKLQAALLDAPDAEPILRKVADALSALSGSERPLLASLLRGGAPREREWAKSPVQPTVLCSTVDQVGSRLLFRGYGVSDAMKPIHAGLLGSDCLILLDEAHLSRPFRQTLESVVRLRRAPMEQAPFAFAVLTATPDLDPARPFGLTDADHAHPTLARRLKASKPARLIDVPGKQGIDTEARRVDATVEEAKRMLASLQASVPHPAVGIVVNRVARARGVFERLRSELPDTCVTLIIGPARSVDRDDRADDLAPIRTGLNDLRAAMSKPLVVVATQTIEAGVDIDFDGLVTEAAAFDALRQRFGRLNRAGRPVKPEAAILAYKDDIGPRADDPVYGDRIRLTWEKLKQLAAPGNEVDFGVEALGSAIGREEAGNLSTPVTDAPILMPAYADLWSQTSPIPNADPEVALFLHGRNRSPASVQVVWRADVDAALIGDRDAMLALLALVPPRAAEAIEVPVWAARRLLTPNPLPTAELSDTAETEPEEIAVAGGRPAFRWAGEESARSASVFGGDLRNGDLIVVPATYGGCDAFGWSPLSRAPVSDVAEKAALASADKRFAVRVTAALIAAGNAADDASAIAANLRSLLGENEGGDADDVLAAVLGMNGLPGVMRAHLQALRVDNRRKRAGAKEDGVSALEAHLDLYGRKGEQLPFGVVFVAPRGLMSTPQMASGPPASETDEDSLRSHTGEPIGLRDHCQHVREWAQDFARRAGLRAGQQAAVDLAGWLHDPGKADPRWQAYATGGGVGPFGPPATEALAKSGKRSPRGAWDRAGLPEKWRHEALSVRLALLRPEFAAAPDRALLLWLIGTHHGYGRPLFPHADETDRQSRPGLLTAFGIEGDLAPAPGPQSLAFAHDGRDWPQMFEHLKREYGIWGLARLEAFVRLADHRASEEGAPPAAAPSYREAAE